LRSEYTALPICQARPEEETGVKEEQEKPDWGINVSEVRRASNISRCHTFPHTQKTGIQSRSSPFSCKGK